MKKNKMQIVIAAIYVAMIMAVTGCLEQYDPPEISSTIDILVVDGSLNSTDNTATVKLTKASALSDNGDPVPELHASVRIEEENGGTFPLIENGAGSYSLSK